MAGTTTMGTTLTLKKAEASGTDKMIARITSIGEMGGEHEEQDVTTLDSPNGAKEFIPAGTDYGEVEVNCNVLKGDQALELTQLFESKTVRDWEVATPKGAKQTFKAFIKAIKYGEKTTDGLDTVKVTLRITGKITYTKGA
jgi:phage major tail protein 2|nr:MAG TPA: tail tube protein [Caudoviricetes sp.]DAY24887.1 MAG TPA: tail tube protein [Caudoviricetes sp.]